MQNEKGKIEKRTVNKEKWGGYEFCPADRQWRAGSTD
jgi:hypothetical protein